ncbi:MAG: undecaprenyldiphospho-muramoylpentapeptide beta-N-acetylglucosaminyltransferase [Oscillospiraceae bacterium]|nr:undecaprenyldiphospho-muramoylpentapeptide beta-N-acetylglucosaminyltransferase [Oscillospiraceae bacterium]
MRFLLACGGSGGHINPALAVAELLRSDGHEVLFVGTPHGLERTLVCKAGFAIEFAEIHSLAHSLSLRAIIRNIGVLVKMAGALRKARGIVRRFSPHAALGTGGYASYPPLRAAAQLGVPVLVHESNALPGVTTKMLAKHAHKILVGMEACRDSYSQKEKTEVVGTPVRGDFFSASRLQARQELRLDNRPLVVSFFGSQGARDMNTLILGVMEQLKKTDAWQHIHVTGSKAYGDIRKRAADLGLDGIHGLRIEEYLHNMPQVMASADLVICRAGASTLAELAATGRPAVLIPSANVANDHQNANAKVFSAQGGAEMCAESALNVQKLYELTDSLLQNTKKLDRMKLALEKSAFPDSAQRIQRLLYEAGKSLN